MPVWGHSLDQACSRFQCAILVSTEYKPDQTSRLTVSAHAGVGTLPSNISTSPPHADMVKWLVNWSRVN